MHQRLFEQWAEHFGKEFSQPSATETLQGPPEPEWTVKLNYPTEEFQRDKATDPDGIPPVRFKGRTANI